jgi:predicted lipoprotein with Yx(FWY)xxD motif/parvulin-like peptidyl-prolyl isomerase
MRNSLLSTEKHLDTRSLTKATLAIVRASMSCISVYIGGAVLLAILGPSACGGRAPNDVVAQVGGRPITKERLDRWLSAQKNPGGGQPTRHAGSQGNRLRQRALEELISAEWAVAQASELGVSVSDREALDRLTQVEYARRQGIDYQVFTKGAELGKALVSAGLSHADRVQLVKLSMLAARIEQKTNAQAEGQVTHAQITTYYEAHKRRFISPERRDLKIFLSYSEATTRRAKREIESGKDFVSVAKRASIEPELPDIVRHIRPGDEEPPFERHVFAARPHTLLGPIHQAVDYYIFEVTKITPPRQQTLSEVEAPIRRQLATEGPQSVSTSLAQASARRWKARTSCRRGYVVPSCAQSAEMPPVLTDSPTPPRGVEVATKHTRWGRIVVAGPDLRTVYLSTADEPTKSNCSRSCEGLWRPVITTAPPTVGELALPRDLGTFRRPDGRLQVTYFHHPLYYYAKDSRRGDLRGQGVKGFGSRWYALRAIGVKLPT